MESWQPTAPSDTPIDALIHWHFRAMPLPAQRDAVRRLALGGRPAYEIAARTGWSLDAVRRFIEEDECLRAMSMPDGFAVPKRTQEVLQVAAQGERGSVWHPTSIL